MSLIAKPNAGQTGTTGRALRSPNSGPSAVPGVGSARDQVSDQTNHIGEVAVARLFRLLQKFTSTRIDAFETFLQFLDHFLTLRQTGLLILQLLESFFAARKFLLVLIERFACFGQAAIGSFGIRFQLLLFGQNFFVSFLLLAKVFLQSLDNSAETIAIPLAGL